MPDDVISAVSPKIPNPWPENMERWLTVVDSQFITRGITQELTKFHHVVGALTPDLADRLRHIICNPPSEKPYTALREAIIKLTALSDRQRYMALMRDVELGDRSPSQLLRHLENLIGNCQFDDGFLRQAFLGKLPPLVQTVLAAVPASATIRELAEIADKVSESHAQPLSVASVARSPAAKPQDDTVSLLLDEVRSLSRELQNLKLQVQRSRSRGRSRSSSRSHSRPSRHENTSGLCWYHHTFGENAKRCRSPCSLSGNGDTRH